MEEMTYITCPNCAATFGVPPEVSAVKCPYCGYTIALQGRTVAGFPAYVLPRRLDANAARSVLLEEVTKQVGVPEKVESAIVKGNVDLIFVPLVVFDVSAAAEIRGGGESGTVEFEGSIAVAAPRTFSWMDDLYVPAAGRVPYDPVAMKGGKMAKWDKNVADAQERARKIGRQKLTLLAGKRGTVAIRNGRVDVQPRDLVYYPVYHVEYGGLHAVLDAVQGTVLFAMYPPKAKARLAAIGGMGAIAAATLAGIALFHTYWPVLAGIAGIFPLAGVALLPVRTFGEKAGYLKTGQVIAALRSTEG